MARNADMLRANIEKCEHATTEALFAEAPGLCDYIWEGWEGLMSLRTMVDNLLLHRVVANGCTTIKADLDLELYGLEAIR